MKLQPPTLKDCQKVRLWRNEVLETLRTPYPLTEEMQEEFYRNVICNRFSPHIYWGIHAEMPEKVKVEGLPVCEIANSTKPRFIGMAGLTFIERENMQAEISLIIDPAQKLKGYGTKAVHLLLDQAFNYLNLELVYGECYLVPYGAQDFWKKITETYEGQWKYIRKGKYWGGQHYDTLYFDIRKDEFRKT